ncbi:uncharacterized protein BDZ99DRAFT_526723 [Mytilinidion resinicola]|uniref:Apple domain-containing protein n=1 Tax=Mytilinidion resinicola TaxID=574789 RepID=A0A6A6Y414_9PEZI|nr:uncharacterized protein BDZ99DRAFT_526723 [Mytilinidion resinicola]KAF2803369.1 hypothetical protein BDZ99DRAFT_526723 [Mytilinidion resinicola]
MYSRALALLLAVAQALPPLNSLTDSAVALSSQPQSPLSQLSISLSFDLGPTLICPPYEGFVRTINGRAYHLYCFNAAYGAWAWLPASKSLAECEAHCHAGSLDCNGLTWFPLTTACAVVYSKDALPYIWDNGYQKVAAVPLNHTSAAFGPGMLCPLPGSDNQVWAFDPQLPTPFSPSSLDPLTRNPATSRFKLSCTNQFAVPPTAKKPIGDVLSVNECALACMKDAACAGFHFYWPYFPGGPVNGRRTCELVIGEVGEGNWTAIDKPNKYLSGLKVGGGECGDEGWNRDGKGKGVEED